MKMSVSEICIKQICVNQGLGVFLSVLVKTINQKISDQNVCGFSSKLNGLNPGKWKKLKFVVAILDLPVNIENPAFQNSCSNPN